MLKAIDKANSEVVCLKEVGSSNISSCHSYEFCIEYFLESNFHFRGMNIRQLPRVIGGKSM